MPTIQQQLDEIKATLEAIRIGIGVLEARLDADASEQAEESERADFNAWADAFDQRWQSATFRDQVSECPLCGKPLIGTDRLFHKECADAEQYWADRESIESDPSANNHPASFGYNVHPSEWGKS